MQIHLRRLTRLFAVTYAGPQTLGNDPILACREEKRLFGISKDQKMLASMQAERNLLQRLSLNIDYI